MHAARIFVVAALVGGCGPGGECDTCASPTTEVACIADPAPIGTEPRVILGRVQGGTFVAFSDGETRQLDYGDQGGQHFYVTARWYAPPPDGVIVLDYVGTANHGGSTVFIEDACSSWLQADTYVQLDAATGQNGTLTAQAGTCLPEGCAYDEAQDRYVLADVIAETEVVIEIVP